MRAMKKDPTFKKVMEAQKELKDTEGFDWLESTELAIDKRKFLLSGELRHGSSLYARFHDLILVFPVSSFILTLHRCV